MDLEPVTLGTWGRDCGLARAVRPEQREDLTLGDAEVDAIEDDLLSVRLPQAVHGNRSAWRVLGQYVHATQCSNPDLGQCQACRDYFRQVAEEIPIETTLELHF
jgi:hypothetical protein